MVTWLPSALDELAEIWMLSTDRQEITRASDRIERSLQHDAGSKGEPYQGIRRILVDEPLAVVFSPYPDDCRVFVIQVRRY
jgi:hypothetical protein